MLVAKLQNQTFQNRLFFAITYEILLVYQRKRGHAGETFRFVQSTLSMVSVEKY